jgi:eukaryotic-like serine/threonine-protein kinase
MRVDERAHDSSRPEEAGAREGRRRMSLRPGMTLDHRYELRERLGAGGQGSVWRAFDRNTEAERALKVVHLPGQDREAAERARREAHLVKDARHPAVVTCHSLFEIPSEDVLVLVFDLVQGSSLADMLEDPRLDRARRLAALRHIAGALAFLHARRIVHRDLKPDNVLVTSVFLEDPADPEGLKLIDFGIAAPRRGPDGSTLSGRFGTPPYMAPELFSAAGLDAQRSPARDVFAFGVIGWELLQRGHPSGLLPRAPAGAYQAEYEHRRRGRDPWPPRALEGRWGSVIAACLALDPEARPQDGGAILSFLAGAPETPAPPEVAAPWPSAPGVGQRPSAPGEGGPPRPITAPHFAPHDVEPEPPAGEASGPPGQAASAPASPVVRTEIAPASSLPQRSAVDRTTPMLPESGLLSSPERASSPGGGGTPGKSLSSETGPAFADGPGASSPGLSSPDGKEYAESFSGGTWPVVAAALVLVAVLAAGTAWLLLGGKG